MKKRTLSIKQKILYTAIVLALLRALHSIPVPFINKSYFHAALTANETLGLLNILTGSGLSNLSFMAIGIMPYITASIVVQLLAVASPALAKLQNSAYTSDQAHYRRIIYKAGIALALMESADMACSFGSSGMITAPAASLFGISTSMAFAKAIVTLSWTVGAVLSLIAAYAINEYILKDGKETGTSLIIAEGILAAYPASVSEIISYLRKFPAIVAAALAVLLAVFIVVLHRSVIYAIKAKKSLPVSYSAKLPGYTSRGGHHQDLHLKMLPGTVIPLIFTTTVFSFLSAVASVSGFPNIAGLFNLGMWFDLRKPWFSAGVLVYAVMVTGFTYYYNSISQPPEKMAEDLKVLGASVNGFRPGRETAALIREKSKYMLLIGSVFLTALSICPVLIGAAIHVTGIKFMGSSLLIVCSVICGIKDDLESYLHARDVIKKNRILAVFPVGKGKSTAAKEGGF